MELFRSQLSRQSTALSFQSREPMEKNCLVLDLDETLIHSDAECYSDACLRVEVLCSTQPVAIYVLPRPGLIEFLDEMKKYYKLYIYTSSHKQYVEAILDKLKVSSYFEKIFSRNYCADFGNKKLEKSLKNLDLPLSRTIFIDDSPMHVMQNALNSIQIKPFKGSANDKELSVLIPTLLKLAYETEVRPVPSKVKKLSLPTEEDCSPKLTEPSMAHVANRVPESNPKIFIRGMHQRQKSMDARVMPENRNPVVDLVAVNKKGMKTFQQKLVPLTIIKRKRNATVLAL